MRGRNLSILVLIVAALGAYIFFHERHQMTSEERMERAGKVFPDLDRDQVSTVIVDNSHGRFVFEKAGGTWRLTDPIEFAANPASVNSVLTSMANLEEERTLSTADVELAAYGLEDPDMTVVLSTSAGARFQLAVGDEAALGSNRALRRGDEPTIVLAPGWFVTDLDKGLDDWRSRDVVDLVAADVASLQVVAGEDRMQAVRNGRRWNLLEPIEDLADADHVSNLISNLNGLRVVEFLGDEYSLAELGLDPPAYEVTIVRSDGGPPVQLDFGSERDLDGTTSVACRRDGSDVFWVNDVAAVRLTKAPVRWRSPTVYDFESWDAERLLLEIGDTSVALTREEGLWTADEGGEVDHGAVQDLLTRLSELEAVEFDLIPPATKAMGTIELTLASPDGEQPETVSYVFHRPFTEGGQAMVVVSARATVMSVDAAAVDEILVDPSALLKPAEPAEIDTEE